MNLDLRYLGRSEVVAASWGMALRLSPNLARPKVFYDAEVKNPLRYREAMSALHDVVVGDLRFKRMDKSGYLAWRAQQAEEESWLRLNFTRGKPSKQARAPAAREAALSAEQGLPTRFKLMHALYWTAWRAWTHETWVTELVRHVIACDPVVTVAPDCVFFEGFAKDESGYGCLFVDRDGFQGDSGSGLGTTNVDYSIALYDHFQGLRNYRATRLQVDPRGFEVKTEGNPDLREEKIDLPPSWLRGFGQLQAAMALPSKKLTLPVEAVYSILAYLKRHREKTGPRSLRFQLVPGRAPIIWLDPWGAPVVCHGKVYEGEQPEEIRVWGRRRLFALARLLPLADRVEVRLLGSGLPWIWTVHLGEMRFVLALSGWTANDWSGSASLEMLRTFQAPSADLLQSVSRHLEQSHSASVPVLAKAVQAPPNALLGALHTLAQQGQAVFDYVGEVYRWRPLMPVALSEAILGPQPPEIVAGKALFLDDAGKFGLRDLRPKGLVHLTATAAGIDCEATLDPDGAMTETRCGCSHYYKFKLRKGPCRHLLALRLASPAHLPAPSPGVVDSRPLQTVFLPRLMRDEVAEQATRQGQTLSTLLEEAWRRAGPAIRACSDLLSLKKSTGELPGGDPVKETLPLAEATVAEITSQAARLDANLSTMVQLAWLLSKKDIRARPTLH